MLLDKPYDFIPLILHTFGRMDIHSCCQLYQALRDTRDNWELTTAFKMEFEEAGGGLIQCDKQSSYFRCTSMYMNGRWEYDHEYFQQMVKRKQNLKGETVNGIITNLREVIRDSSSSSEDRSIPDLKERAREDSASDGNTNFFGRWHV